MKTILFVLATFLFVASSDQASAQCGPNGCTIRQLLPVRIVRRVVQSRPIQRVAEVQPVQRVIEYQPVQRVMEYQPVRRVLYWRPQAFRQCVGGNCR